MHLNVIGCVHLHLEVAFVSIPAKETLMKSEHTCIKGLSIWHVRKNFQKTNVSYRLIRTRVPQKYILSERFCIIQFLLLLILRKTTANYKTFAVNLLKGSLSLYFSKFLLIGVDIRSKSFNHLLIKRGNLFSDQTSLVLLLTQRAYLRLQRYFTQVHPRERSFLPAYQIIIG